MAMNEFSDVTFEIIEEIGVIGTQDTGWTKELNLISWNGGVAKYDIREWDLNHVRMSKGITLKEEEMRRILDLMKKRRAKARFRGRAELAADSPEPSDSIEQRDAAQDLEPAETAQDLEHAEAAQAFQPADDAESPESADDFDATDAADMAEESEE